MKKRILAAILIMFLSKSLFAFVYSKSCSTEQRENIVTICLRKIDNLNIWKSFFNLARLGASSQKAEEILHSFFELLYDVLKEIEIENLKIDSPHDSKLIAHLEALKKAIDKDEFYKVLEKIIDSESKEALNDFIKQTFFVLESYFESDIEAAVGIINSLLTEYLANKSGFVEEEEFVYRDKKKKKKIASAIFGALANACVHGAQIATAQSEEEKQQGVLNLLGTAFGLASQVAAISASEEQRSIIEDDYDKILDLTVSLVENVCEMIKREGINIDDGVEITLLIQFNKLDSESKRREGILNSLVSSSLAQNILDEAFSYLRQYLHCKVDDIIDFLRDKLLYLILGHEPSHYGSYYYHHRDFEEWQIKTLDGV